jgi:hypothetical protein
LQAANVGYAFDRSSGLSQLAHLYAVTNAHSKCVVQRALRDDASLRTHLKSCGLNPSAARGDVQATNMMYTTLMRTAPSFVNEHILQYGPPLFL